jgi:cysteine sulfinate desulfinase/cysteine desulfurase-like protein
MHVWDNRVDLRLDSFVDYTFIVLVVFMPPKKSKQIKGDQLRGARETKLEKEAIVESDTALNNLQSSFRESKAYVTQLKQQLADQVQICTDLQNNLDTSHDLINTIHIEILSLKSKNSDTYHKLRMERQRCKRATSKHGSMTS